MKSLRPYLPPLALLAVILVFSLWNSACVTRRTDRWRDQLQQADALAQAEDWPEAVNVLTAGYEDWSDHQTYLHIVSQHDAVDDAEAMYHRCLAFAATQEVTEFRAELADLRDQLRLLAEMERFIIGNVL